MKLERKQALQICGYALAVIIIVWVGYEILLSVPINCHYEYGTIIETWEEDNLFYIKFNSSTTGTERTVWLMDSFPERINPMDASLQYDFSMDDNVAFQWCYIPSINKERGRGAWTW